MRFIVTAASVAACVLLLAPGVSADVNVAAPSVIFGDGTVSVRARWCPVLVTEGQGPKPCSDAETWAWIAPSSAGGSTIAREICVPQMDEVVCFVGVRTVVVESVSVEEDRVVLYGNVCGIRVGEPGEPCFGPVPLVAYSANEGDDVTIANCSPVQTQRGGPACDPSFVTADTEG